MLRKLFITLIVATSAPAWATDLVVEGRAYSPKQCAYYSSNHADFVVTYRNENFPWGTRIFLHYGFHDSFRQKSWQRISTVEAIAVAPFTWQAKLSAVEVDARATYAFDRFQFVMRVELPNERIVYDNGGQDPMGYYEANIPPRVCTLPAFLDRLPVTAVRSES